MKKKLISKTLALALSGMMLFSMIGNGGIGVARVEAAEGIPVTKEFFPDDDFRSIVSVKDLNQDGILSQEEISKIQSFYVEERVSLKSVEGINYLTSIKKLFVRYNSITELDISGLSELEYLNCSNNQLKKLDLSNNNKLIILNCSENDLESLDISNCPKLGELNCLGNKLKSLDVSSMSEGYQYYDVDGGVQTGDSYAAFCPNCNGDAISNLRLNGESENVIKYTAAKEATCTEDGHSESSVCMHCGTYIISPESYTPATGHQFEETYDPSTENTVYTCKKCLEKRYTVAINKTNFPDDELRAVISSQYDMNQDGLLTYQECYRPEYTFRVNDRKIKNTKGLEFFTFYGIAIDGAELSDYDFSMMSELKSLSIQKGNLDTLDVKKLPDVENLYLSINNFTSLDLSGLKNLKVLYLTYNSISELKVNDGIESLHINDNQIAHLDLKNCEKLSELYCYNNPLESLDLHSHYYSQIWMCSACYDNGLDDRDWSNCGKYVDTDSHPLVEKTSEGISPTCTMGGRSVGTYCSECKNVLVEEKAIPALGHKWDNGVVTKEATEEEDGEKIYTCTVCEETKKEVITKKQVAVSYRTQVQGYGWMKAVEDGKVSGTTGESKRLEAILINVSGNDNLGIQYTTHCQTYGWLPWSSNGEINGTEGESKRMEAIKLQLTGSDASKYDVYYRVHAQSYGWLGWAKNGEMAGTAGLSKRLEGIQIVVTKKGAGEPGDVEGIKSVRKEAQVTGNGASSNPNVSGTNNSNLAVRTHIQSIGWQGWKYNGQMSGTSGQSKRLEAINIKLSNQQYSGGIEYRTHVQKYGWMNWVKDGAMSGTSGEAKRLEAIQIRLYGEMAEKYDVYYRVHAQRYGWLGWAKNGEMAGTAGYSYRLEGIQVVLVPKGQSAPANTYQGVTGNAKANPYEHK